MCETDPLARTKYAKNCRNWAQRQDFLNTPRAVHIWRKMNNKHVHPNSNVPNMHRYFCLFITLGCQRDIM